MTTVEEDSTAPSFRFKRRKTIHTKRSRISDDATIVSNVQSSDTATTLDAPEVVQDEEESALSLKDIIRNRKRPRDRFKDVARKTESTQAELVQLEAPRPDRYTSRFVAQTGQVVDTSDKQM
jgi:hypothetical protein